MAVLLSCSGLRKSLGARILFDNFSLSLSEGDRIGLIGPNGSGKTTLLQILAGIEPADSGDLALRRQTSVRYVPQDSVFEPGQTVVALLEAAVAGLHIDAQQKTSSVQVMLGRAGFPDPTADAATLSGGWKKRLAIAAALVASPDILLLDEPTNHLDLEGIEWLEASVAAANASLIVTHDRYVLENIATGVVEVNHAYPDGAFATRGNYSEFLMRREEFLAADQKQREALANKVRREIEWLRRGPKARTGKSKARISEAGRLIDSLAESTARNATRTAAIDFTASDRKTKRLVEAEGITVSLGGRTLFRDLDLVLKPGTRIGLVGANGSGKTTLLRVLEGSLSPDAGSIRRAEALRVVSFAQDRAAHLDLDSTLRDSLCPDGDSVIYRDRPVHVAGWAKRFGFATEQLEMPVSRLSGGERARVLIARLMLEPADLLLLDEPTNDLDIPTLEVLEESLLEFTGALVMVSHDRYLLDRVSTAVVGLDPDGSTGLYADYAQWQAFRGAKDDTAQDAQSAEPLPDNGKRTNASPRRKLSYLEQREFDAMEQRILEAEEQVAEFEHQVQEFASDAGKLPGAYAGLEAAQARVAELYERWAELEQKVAQ